MDAVRYRPVNPGGTHHRTAAGAPKWQPLPNLRLETTQIIDTGRGAGREAVFGGRDALLLAKHAREVRGITKSDGVCNVAHGHARVAQQTFRLLEAMRAEVFQERDTECAFEFAAEPRRRHLTEQRHF